MPCVTSIPFESPVVPVVYKISAVSPAFGKAGSSSLSSLAPSRFPNKDSAFCIATGTSYLVLHKNRPAPVSSKILLTCSSDALCSTGTNTAPYFSHAKSHMRKSASCVHSAITQLFFFIPSLSKLCAAAFALSHTSPYVYDPSLSATHSLSGFWAAWLATASTIDSNISLPHLLSLFPYYG